MESKGDRLPYPGGQVLDVFEADDYTMAQFIPAWSDLTHGALVSSGSDDPGQGMKGRLMRLSRSRFWPQVRRLYGFLDDWEAPVVGYNPGSVRGATPYRRRLAKHLGTRRRWRRRRRSARCTRWGESS